MVFLLCKSNRIILYLGLLDKECLFLFRLEPKDEVINLLLFGQLQMACKGIEVIYIHFY